MEKAREKASKKKGKKEEKRDKRWAGNTPVLVVATQVPTNSPPTFPG